MEPLRVYPRGQNEVKAVYYVALEGRQVIPLIWHAVLGEFARWEWLNGKVFNGNVLAWASEPLAP